MGRSSAAPLRREEHSQEWLCHGLHEVCVSRHGGLRVSIFEFRFSIFWVLLAVFGQAVVADAADFGARDGDLDAAVVRDLFFELFVEPGFEFAYLAAAQAGDMDVVAWAVRFVIVTIAAKVQEIEFVDEALLLQQIDGAIDGDEVNLGIDFLRAGEDLIDVQVLFGGVHHLQDDAALAGEADATLAQGVLQAGGRGGVDALAAGDAVTRVGGHEWSLAGARGRGKWGERRGNRKGKRGNVSHCVAR
jgi:hypothetical protein